MEKYQRFTKKTDNLGNIIYLGDGISIDQDMNNNNLTYAYGEALDYLAELEDKMERGELVENTVITYVSMARCNGKTLIDKALKFDKLKAKIENGTLLNLPCIRAIDSPLGKYEAVYINTSNLIQECVVSTEEQGWLVIAHSGNNYCKAQAKAKLKELQND